MTDHDPTSELADKLAIHEVLYRYARALDTKDWPLMDTVFVADAKLDYTDVGGPDAPRNEVIAWLEASLNPMPMIQHSITNIEVDLRGDEASVVAMFHNPMQLPGIDGITTCGGRYHHEMVRTPDGWRSRSLREENLWFTNPPAGYGG